MFKMSTHQAIMFLAGAIVIAGHATASAAQDRAKERDGVPIRSFVKLYGGQPLEVWQKRFGELKPTSEYAAELVPGLIEIVEDRQAPDVLRERAALTLGRTGKPAVAAVAVLREILADPNEPLFNRVWAARALGYFGKYASPAADALIEFLFDEDVPREHRPVPVEALGRIGSGHPDVVPALLRLFQYTPDETSGMSPGDVTRLRELATEAFAMMGKDADLATPLLMRAVRNPSEAESIRRKAVIALGQIGTNAAIATPALIESLEFDPSEAVRDEAARSLAKLGEPAWDVLRRYLEHPDPTVRSRVAAAFGQLKLAPRNIVVDLLNAISDPHEGVRMAAIESLGKLATGRDKSLPAAIQLLTSEDRQIRMRAMRLILAHQPLQPSEYAALQAMRDDDRPATARIVDLVLNKLDGVADE